MYNLGNETVLVDLEANCVVSLNPVIVEFGRFKEIVLDVLMREGLAELLGTISSVDV